MGSLCGVSLRRSVTGELEADGLEADESRSAPVGLLLSPLLLFLPPEETTNTERGDAGPLGGVEGSDDDEEEAGEAEAGAEGDGNSCLAGVAGADWIARGAAAAAATAASESAAAGAEAASCATSSAAASAVSPAPPRLLLLSSAIPAIARACLGVVVEYTEPANAAAAVLFCPGAFFAAAAAAAATAAAPPVAFFFFSPFFIPPAPLSAPLGPKNLA